MKKILIISYFFPPCNLTAAQRAFGWAEHLHLYGYYPIIITRNWDIEINTPADSLKKTGSVIKHVKYDNYEIYYLPYKGCLRDFLYTKFGENKLKFFRKFLTFSELILQNFTNWVIPYKNLYYFSKNYIKKNPDIKSVIITGNPFILFKFGYLLAKKTNISWIADYRDDWNTSELKKEFSLIEKIIFFFEEKSEKKWLKTAATFTSISNHYVNKIGTFINQKGHPILNGFFEKDFSSKVEIHETDSFTIIYNGTLYPTQKIELFLDAYKKFLDFYSDFANQIKLKFIGLAYDSSQAYRVEKYMGKNSHNIEISPRISRKKIIELQKNANILLMVAHDGIKGIPSSKLYEYLGLGKPIISFPSDNDIIDGTLSEYNLGFVCNSENDILKSLSYLFEKFKDNTYSELITDTNYTLRFTRSNQTKQLAKILDDIQ